MNVLSSLLLFLGFMPAQDAPPHVHHVFHVVEQWTVPGGGRWDYLTADVDGRRLYVTHGEQVDVLNLDTGEVVGTIGGLNAAHGVALAPKLNRGFISDGGRDRVVVFDLDTLKKITEIPAGHKPDSILYENATSQVFVFNGVSKDATVIDAKTAAIAGTINLGGSPGFAVADDRAHVYVNVERDNVTLDIDAKTRTVLRKMPVAPCESPSALALDPATRRLFLGCDKKLAVLDMDAGKIVTTVPIGDGNDSVVFEPETKRIFAANADATLNVIHEDAADVYRMTQTVQTSPRSKTMAMDRKTHRALVPSAEYLPKPKDAAFAPIRPGSFRILVIGKEPAQ